MSKELSSGTEHAPARALFKALGLTDEEISKPVIAVISAYNQADTCGASLLPVVEAVKTGIVSHDGTPFVVPCLSPCNSLISSGGAHYCLPLRELIADGVESILSAYSFDGAVLVTGGEESIAGMVMGALRVNIPTIAISGGPMLSGNVGGKKAGMADIYEMVAKIQSGKASISDLTALENGACVGYGSYNGMYSTNALNCVCEALGLTLPGSGSIPASNPERIRLCKRTGETIMKLVSNDVRPRMILSKDAIHNAFALTLSTGSNTNALLHLLAIAAEYESDTRKLPTLDTIQAISDSVPSLCDIDGETDMQDFYEAGGVQAVLYQLNKKGLIKHECLTVSGSKIGAQCADCDITGDAIKSVDSPLYPTGGIAVLKGNIADDGAIIRRNTVNKQTFSGKAKCYNSEEECYRAITGGEVSKGDVLIIRYEGPMGGPGMSEILRASAAINGLNLNHDVAIITDGRLSGISHGWAIGHVCPEAAAGGKLAYVKNGDKINIDVKNGRINVDITAKELQTRMKKYSTKDDEPNGWLLRYKYGVTTAAQGCVLKKKF